MCAPDSGECDLGVDTMTTFIRIVAVIVDSWCAIAAFKGHQFPTWVVGILWTLLAFDAFARLGKE